MTNISNRHFMNVWFAKDMPKIFHNRSTPKNASALRFFVGVYKYTYRKQYLYKYCQNNPLLFQHLPSCPEFTHRVHLPFIWGSFRAVSFGAGDSKSPANPTNVAYT